MRAPASRVVPGLNLKGSEGVSLYKRFETKENLFREAVRFNKGLTWSNNKTSYGQKALR